MATEIGLKIASKDAGSLTGGLKSLLALLYVTYFRGHSAHWNITGPFFSQLHDLFGDFADDTYGSIDNFAESMRQHDVMAPVDLCALLREGPAQDKASTDGGASSLIKEIKDLNKKVMEALAALRPKAESAGDFGLANFIQDREAAHLKWDWKLKSLMP